LRGLFANLALVFGSLVVFGALAEFVLLPLLGPSDIPKNAYIEGVLRYVPGQEGVYRKRGAVEAHYRINAQGWNAARDFERPRGAATCRIVAIGDSYVEAFQVDVGGSFAELLETLYGKNRAEVLRFGVSGAPLSQYLAMIEREAAAYGPDVIVVNLVHNDFIESYRPLAGRFTRSFLTLDVREGRVVGENPGEVYVAPAMSDWLRLSATFRYFYYRWGITPDTVRALIAKPRTDGARHEANIDVAELDREWPNIVASTEHLMRRIKAAGQARGVPVIFLIDGVRQAIYAGREAASIDALRLNRLVVELAAKLGVVALDLHPIFEARWRADRQPFDFGADDGHWNERGHAVAAETLRGALRLLGEPCGG